MRLIPLLVSTLMLTSYAAAQNCGFPGSLHKTLSRDLQSKNITEVRIDAKAGDLRVIGHASKNISIEGLACSNSKALLNQIEFTTRVQGKVLYVEARVPEGSMLQQAGLHLTLNLPDPLNVEIYDTSGDLVVQGINNLKVWDRSGDMDITDLSGNLLIAEDEAGDIDIHRVKKSVQIDRDSAGDILIEQVSGAVSIGKDGSGDLTILDAGNTTVNMDDSGDIHIEHIQGNVLIGRDDSGDINVYDVSGNLMVRQDGSGDINFDQVRGNAQVPRKR